MKWSGLFLVSLLTLSSLISCASVSDSVISSIDQEQINRLNDIYRLIQDYRFNDRKDSLISAEKKLDAVDLKEIYNEDYKAKIIGFKALTSFYRGKTFESERLLRDLEQITMDEEMFWIVSALLKESKSDRLKLLIEGSEKVFSIDRINSYLAFANLENEEYGEAAALYDTILLEESDFIEYYRNMRELAFLFMQNPPSSFETGSIIAGDQIDMSDLIDIIYLETEYFTDYNREQIVQILLDKKYFFEDAVLPENPLVRKELAYFLFALVADRNRDESLWEQYDEYYNPDLTDEMKEQLKGMSPIGDIPAFRYYFYPVLYLVEDEIMELPDGEHFFPYDLVRGTELIDIISGLERRVE